MSTSVNSLDYTASGLTADIRSAYRELLPHQNDANDSGKLDWKYVGHPSGAEIISAALDDGKVVGIIGGVAARLRCEGKLIDAVQALDTVVSPAARGQGCFVRMAERMHAEARTNGLDAIYGFPNANAAPGWFGRLGWTRLGRMTPLFKPLRAGILLRRVARTNLNFPLAFPRKQRGDIRAIDRFDQRAGDLWRRFAGPDQCGVERDAAYLNWRLVDPPFTTYARFGYFDGDELRSMVVTRLADKHGGKLGYVMEALGDETLPRLLEHALADLKANGAEAALAWCLPHSANRAVYRKRGFFAIPQRFAPEINLGAFALTPAGEPLLNASRWYISYLDSDTV